MRQAATLSNPWGIKNEYYQGQVWICTGPRHPWAQLWHQLRHYGRPSHIAFKNPDFVKYAESFGAKGYRVSRAEDLAPTLRKAFADNTVVLIDCPVDYAENMRLTARLNEMKAPQ